MITFVPVTATENPNMPMPVCDVAIGVDARPVDEAVPKVIGGETV